MPPERAERKLAAILAADVAGYSRLMGADEEGTLAQLKAHRRELIDPKIREHHGRIVKTTGDGILIEFPSVVEAVGCAVEVQRGIAERNAGVPEDKRITFRVGINLGDIIVEGKDIYGDGVNVAARLQELAEPGGVCVSRNVRNQVRDKLPFSFEDLGEQTVKNIARPLRVFRVSWDAPGASGGRAAVEPARPALSLPDKPSIAVLPFQNLSGDPEQEYFADGIVEEITTALAHVRSFFVIARNSSFTYKGKAIDVKQVGRELGVRYVLEGSVRCAGDRVRITAQLIDAKTGHHLWAERFDRQLDDIFALQDEIAYRVAATVEPELEKAELERSAAKRPSALDAWDYYLRGMAFLHEFKKEGNEKAREMFGRALELDPVYGQAYAGLALSHNRDILLECAEDRKKSLARAIEAARRAVELDETSSFAHQVLSTAYIWGDMHEPALEEARLAVELNPSDAVSLHALGNKSDLAGDPDGISMMERAQQLNPRNPQRHAHLAYLARAYANAHQYERSVECARRAILRKPNYPHAHFILAIALGHLGRIAEARDALNACERIHPGFIMSRAHWCPYTNPQSNEHLHDGLRKAGLPE